MSAATGHHDANINTTSTLILLGHRKRVLVQITEVA
jgi:hypothetical protein